MELLLRIGLATEILSDMVKPPRWGTGNTSGFMFWVGRDIQMKI
jgi:hypothetical protein